MGEKRRGRHLVRRYAYTNTDSSLMRACGNRVSPGAIASVLEWLRRRHPLVSCSAEWKQTESHKKDLGGLRILSAALSD